MMMKVAVVTGASSGIGRAISVRLSRAGYALSLNGRDEKALAETAKMCKEAGAGKVRITVGDLCDELNARKLVEDTVLEYQRINTLINSAGILVSGNVLDSNIDQYDRQMDVNVRSVVRLTRMALPYIMKTKGTVVSVSSITGPCPFPGVSYYCMSKAALDQFTKCLALEMAPHGVRVNAVNPALIVTNIHKRSGMDDKSYQEFVEKGKVTHALGRVGEASEVAEAVLFLASEKSSFTTGELLRVDGGRGIMHPR
ncbi:hypothetical protein RB195_006553 [Necator americanus]|uniref:Ketoreductase domain-containing protein n=1 Tax=Necator americanus TaxID=51031 RepID=A0ABR1BW26_NECAM